MPKELPYLPSYKNVGKLFEKIATAKIPEAFTHKYLYDTLGIKGNSDRPLISLLKALGFIDNSGKPTSEYSKLKNPMLAPAAIATGIKKAYAPLFDANEIVHTLGSQDIKGLIAQVGGTDSDMTSKIAGTFNSLVKLANFTAIDIKKPEIEDEEDDDEEDASNDDQNEKSYNSKNRMNKESNKKRMHPEFHYNIQIHLPSNASEETYLNIFNALRKSFQ